MSTSWSGGADACERFGSGGLGRPRWGVVIAAGWECCIPALRLLRAVGMNIEYSCEVRAHTHN